MSRATARPGRPIALAGPAMALALLVAAGLGGCAARPRYVPAQQPSGVSLSAGVRVADDRLRVDIDSEGYRVERAAIARADGTEVEAEALLPGSSGGPGFTLGLGLGAGGWGSGGSYSVGTGVGIPLGGGRAPSTIAVFRLDQAGPPPWRLRVKVVGVEPVEILLNPPSS